MLNSAFDGVGAKPGDFYPAALRAEIDTINARVYDTLNNGVYKEVGLPRRYARSPAISGLT